MYWKRRFDRRNPDQEIEEEMLKIRNQHKDYGYLRMTKELVNRGFHVNKKKVQRLIRKLGIEVRSFTRRSRRYNSYRGKTTETFQETTPGTPGGPGSYGQSAPVKTGDGTDIWFYLIAGAGAFSVIAILLSCKKRRTM